MFDTSFIATFILFTLVVSSNSLSPISVLIDVEDKNLELLSRFIQHQSNVIGQLETLNSSLNQSYNVQSLNQNPIDQFNLVMRSTNEWKKVTQLSSSAREIKLIETKISTPETNSLKKNCIQSLINLQKTYNLSAHDIAMNNISNTYNHGRSIKLDSRICYNIAVEYYSLKDYKKSIDWFNVALNIQNQDSVIDRIFILNALEGAYFNEGLISDALDTYHEQMKYAEETELSESNRIGYESLIKYGIVEEDEVFHRLCTHGDQRPISELSKLKCYIKDTKYSNPYIRYMLVKIESFHSNPDILLYHDIFSDNEMESMINDTKREMNCIWNKDCKRSKYHEPRYNGGELIRHGKRFDYSKSGTDYNNSIAQTVHRRIEYFTGLKARTESFLTNYAFVGYKPLHYDSKTSNKKNQTDIRDFGTRIYGTSFAYLNDVKVGGETVFNIFGVSVKPVKGSLLFWYNLNRNGYSDSASKHAACPVVVGTKWNLLDTFRIAGNEFNVKCLNWNK